MSDEQEQETSITSQPETIGNTPVQDEQSKAPAKGELRDEELEKASGGSVRLEPPNPC